MKRHYIRMKKRYFGKRFCFLSILTMGLLSSALALPSLTAFTTANRGYEYNGALTVGSAFAFIFGGNAQVKMHIGVGEAIATIACSDVFVAMNLKLLIGYCAMIGGAFCFILSFVFIALKKRKTAILFAWISLLALIAGGVLFLISKSEVAAAFYGISNEEAKTAIESTGLSLDIGLLGSAIFAFAASLSTFLSLMVMPKIKIER